ncbi:hypothetical protein MKW92_020590, partial [Papaver armeniacum]
MDDVSPPLLSGPSSTCTYEYLLSLEEYQLCWVRLMLVLRKKKMKKHHSFM